MTVEGIKLHHQRERLSAHQRMKSLKNYSCLLLAKHFESLVYAIEFSQPPST